LSFAGWEAARFFAEVLVDVVELPLVAGDNVDSWNRCGPRRSYGCGGGDPAVVVDGAVAEEFEVLRAASRWSLGLVEGVLHADAFDGALLDSVDFDWRWYFGGVEYGWKDVDDVVPLRAHGADIFDLRGPRDDHAVACAAIVRGDLLGPLERRVHRNGPAYREVVVGLPRAEVVDVRKYLLGSEAGSVHRAFEVERAVEAGFGAGSVVADDVEDERVVGKAHLVDGFDDAAYVVVSLLEISGVDLHHPLVQLLLVRGESVPGGDAFGARGQLRVLRNEA
jgi:hypothetical protein